MQGYQSVAWCGVHIIKSHPPIKFDRTKDIHEGPLAHLKVGFSEQWPLHQNKRKKERRKNERKKERQIERKTNRKKGRKKKRHKRQSQNCER